MLESLWPWSRKRPVPQQRNNPWALNRELWTWSREDAHTIGDSVKNWCALGATGMGKTSGPAAFIGKSHLAAGFGGMFTAVKPTDLAEQLGWCRETGREEDVIIFGSLESPWRFNFLDYALQKSGPSNALTENIVQLLLNVLELRERKSGNGGGGENAEFFANAKKQILRCAVDVLVMAKSRITVGDIYKMIISAPTSLDQLRSEDWRKRSFCLHNLAEADQREKNPSRREDLALSADYWLVEYPGFSDRTRTSITSTVTGLIDVLQRSPLRELLCTTTTVTPDDIANGKVLLHALNTKQFADVAELVQVILKYSYQRAIECRDLTENPRPNFLQIDEFQHLTTSYDAIFAQTCRSSGVSFGLLSQSLPVLYAALGGGDKAKVEIDALLGNTSLRIFCASGCHTTNQAASEMIGRTRQYTMNSSSSGGDDRDVFSALCGQSSKHSAGLSEIFEFEVQPQVFTQLRPGGPPDFAVDTIIFRPGRPFAATGRNWMPVTFNQK